jgi:hypothetical protein
MVAEWFVGNGRWHKLEPCTGERYLIRRRGNIPEQTALAQWNGGKSDNTR